VDAERITMPEYLALIHFRETVDGDNDLPPPSTDDVNAMFLRMERAGISKVN